MANDERAEKTPQAGSTGEATPEWERAQREHQDRSRGSRGQAQSPVDSMHVDAPKHKDNAHGHREGAQRKE